MSGEAGGSIQSTYYHIRFSSGVMVSVEEPPHIEGEERNLNYVSDYFESENKHYIDKLNKLKPSLDALFNQLVAGHDLPILKLDLEASFFNGVIIEDTEKIQAYYDDNEQIESWLKNQTTPKMDLNWSFHNESFETINISITVNKRVLRSVINRIQSSILELFDSDHSD